MWICKKKTQPQNKQKCSNVFKEISTHSHVHLCCAKSNPSKILRHTHNEHREYPNQFVFIKTCYDKTLSETYWNPFWIFFFDFCCLCSSLFCKPEMKSSCHTISQKKKINQQISQIIDLPIFFSCETGQCCNLIKQKKIRMVKGHSQTVHAGLVHLFGSSLQTSAHNQYKIHCNSSLAQRTVLRIN